MTTVSNSLHILTLPYLLKSVFRSVALVVEERPLTHRFLLLLAAAPLPAATHKQNKLMTTYPLSVTHQKRRKIIHSLFSSFDSVLPSFSSELETKKTDYKHTAVRTPVIVPHIYVVTRVFMVS